MQLFYAPDIDPENRQFSFGPDESRHIVRVLRKKVGDELRLTNGKGFLFHARLVAVGPKDCRVEVETVDKHNRPMHRLHLAVAPTKSTDRFEWFLEKATEIGVDEITPIACNHSERRVLKTERLKKVVANAMKQSNRTYLPVLNELTSFEEFVAERPEELLFIAHCKEEEKSELKRKLAADKEVLILIGPEGDFSEEEIDLAMARGFIPVSMGEARLRTETAAIVAAATVSLINGR